MKYLIRNKQKEGFSLAEVIVAIFIITIGITGSLSLISYSISSAAVGKSQIIATSLAQEGMEIIRNIRDSNWLEDVDWDDGLVPPSFDCTAGCLVQYDSTSLLSLSGNPVLQINSNGLYQYGSGTNTHFKRKITINSIGLYLKVVSEVTWSERGRSFSVSAEDRLYDWK